MGQDAAVIRLNKRERFSLWFCLIGNFSLPLENDDVLFVCYSAVHGGRRWGLIQIIGLKQQDQFIAVGPKPSIGFYDVALYRLEGSSAAWLCSSFAGQKGFRGFAAFDPFRMISPELLCADMMGLTKIFYKFKRARGNFGSGSLILF